LPWRGTQRRVRLVIYRRLQADDSGDHVPEQALNQACERLCSALLACGVPSERLDGAAFYRWLLPWVNPAPRLSEEAPQDFRRRVPYPTAGEGDSLELPLDHDFAERLFFNQPRSDTQSGLWYFDDQPHQVIVVDKLR